MYNYIDPPKSISKKLLTRLNVGFVGRFEIEKGLNKFMDILSKINDKKIFFSIFGEGSIKIKELKDKNINVYKWSKKKLIYNKIDILFVTSKIENCPFNVLEAKSYGIPTVTTSKGGIKEIISNNKDGFIINNYNSEKIIINKFYHIWKNYNYFKINALNNSKNYSLDNYHKFLRLF
jgi:glycosyltransferase involved in cell wall biosynthesis